MSILVKSTLSEIEKTIPSRLRKYVNVVRLENCIKIRGPYTIVKRIIKTVNFDLLRKGLKPHTELVDKMQSVVEVKICVSTS